MFAERGAQKERGEGRGVKVYKRGWMWILEFRINMIKILLY